MWLAFLLGRSEMPYVAAVLASGSVQVGLEDNLWLGKGELATDEKLAARAVTILEAMGNSVIRFEAVRKMPGLVKRAAR